MKRVVKFQTFDGVVHDSPSNAKLYLDKLYGDALTKIVHQLIRTTKYLEYYEYVDSHLEDFAHISTIKNDFELINDDDE